MPNPKGYGQLAQINIVGLLPFFGEWAGKLLFSQRCLWGMKKMNQIASKNQKKRHGVELGKSHFLI